jgi:hypothetical protein
MSLLVGVRGALPTAADAGPVRAARIVGLAGFAVLAVAPVTAALAVVVGVGDRSWLPAASAAMLLALCGTASVVPRADLHHVRSALPLTIGAVFAGVAVILRGVGGAAETAVAAVGVAAGLGGLIVSHRAWRHLGTAVDPGLDLPHLAGLSLSFTAPAPVVDGAAELRRLTGGTVFLLRRDAALWYLAGDLVNPTPFDWPFASTFGPHGQREVIDRFATGEIEWCCFRPANAGRLSPAELEAWVPVNMVAVAETAAGTLYRSPAAASDDPVDK